MNETNPQASLLFVDDDPRAGDLLSRFCKGSSYACHTYRDPREALAHFERQGAQVIVSDLRMPGMDGIELLGRVRELDDEVPVIIITAYSSLDHAIEALRLGATDFLKKPFDMEELILVVDKAMERFHLKQENRRLRRELGVRRKEMGLVGQSPALQQTYSLIQRVADVRCNVIIHGESGTGKEVAARSIHDLGPNPDAPFIVVDCGALNDTLLESELFGHEKGAFTGAAARKQGLFEVARGGTVFLDEIGNISQAMQIKLLRVIQERQITRVGGVQPIDVDVRCLVATNADLQEMVHQGTFREDLYHRLNVVTITMPPLRDRKEDIPILLQRFIEQFSCEYGRRIEGFEAESLRKLESYNWPGNVRELKNLVERSVVLSDGPQLHLAQPLDDTSGNALQSTPEQTLPLIKSDDLPTLRELEHRYIAQVLEYCDGNRKQAAGLLGIDTSTLWRKLQQ